MHLFFQKPAARIGVGITTEESFSTSAELLLSKSESNLSPNPQEAEQ